MIPYAVDFFLLGLIGLVVADKRQEAEKFLEQGKILLASGQFNEALQQYHSAIDLDPTNYQAYFRRATVMLATGKIKGALPDLDKVVELKPDFIAGRVQRGNLLVKQGKLAQAGEDFKITLKNEPSHSEATEKIEKVKQLQELYEQVDELFENDDYEAAEKILDRLMEECMWDASLHRKRAKCRKMRGDIQNAISDVKAIAKLIPDSTEVYLETAQMYYDVGDVENSLGQVRECLKLNPDHKTCFPFYKRVKKLGKMREQLEKASKEQKWTECLKKGQDILKYEQNIDNIQWDVFKVTCKCNREAGHVAEAIQECSEVLKYGIPDDLDILLERGEAYLLAEEWDKAIEDFQQAVNAHSESRKAKESLNRAQKMKTQAGKKDYYKILGVKRNASKREIEKAYRKLAHKWHPDNFQDDAEKKKAQEKFINIAEAKDVLTDPEKRQLFDQGEDPNDPNAGHGHHHHPFHGFQGFPGGFGGGFGGGGQQYSFKFTNF
ncbi:unnamed protein product [Bursaphelenchus okinawaensis]|uniref:J domain-containing protein n=1 Tax=Bursaphelenchus okinawaensis TaxID=465554 RepID=A0A811LPW5_9BILA|nr:unnamed protein product [Bursaphelenchus okinawaensis]CAG9126705.1 unnamed protein product [Bursaphelenchus okinawaensis]